MAAGNILIIGVIPALKNDDYDSGIYMGFSALVNVICSEYGINIDKLHVVEIDDSVNTTGLFYLVFVLIVIVILVLNLKRENIKGIESMAGLRIWGLDSPGKLT